MTPPDAPDAPESFGAPTGRDPESLAPGERRELLSAYLDGALSAEDALAVSVWLDAHPDALREVEHLRRLWDLLGRYQDEPVPSDFAAGVLRAVGLDRAASGAGRIIPMAWYRRPLATAAAVLLAVGATALVMSDRGEQPPAATATTSVVSLLRDVPAEQLEDVLLNADVLLSLGDAAFEDGFDEETVLGG